jgi:hypothetical protein
MLGGLGVSIVCMISATLVGDIGLSMPGRLDDRAEKNGCSNSLIGDSNALGMAGTGGTISLSSLTPLVSSLGFGVGSLDEEPFWENRFGIAGTAFIFCVEL